MNFGYTGATNVTVVSPTSITCTNPAGNGDVYVTVTNSVGTSQSTSAALFAYVSPPTVSSVAPSAGPTGGGTSVTISGNYFTGATAVYFGTTPAASFGVN